MFDDLHDPDPPTPGPHHLATVAERAERRRRRRTAAVMATTTVILVAGGVTALAVRDPARDAASTPTTAMPAPPTPVRNSAPSTTALPATTPPNTATTTTPPASALPTTSAPTNVITREAAEPAPPELVELADAIAGRARSIDSFGAVVHQVQEYPGRPASEITRSVVFRSDGAMWASDESGGWASHDPSTGTARTAFPMPPDGPLAYQEISGWNENGVGEQIMFGHALVLDVTGLSGEITIGEDVLTDLGDRPVWRIEQRFECCRIPDSDSYTDVNVYWIDQQTGITLASDLSQTTAPVEGDASVTRRLSEVVAFEPGAPLPTEFPGVFPEDASVDRSGDPAAFTGDMSEADLVSAFGTGLLVPDIAGSSGYVELQWQNTNDAGLPIREDGSATHVMFHRNLGFQRVVIGVARSMANAPSAGVEPVATVPGGALDGLAMYPREYGGYVVFAHVNSWSIEVGISGTPSIEQAAELLGTLRSPDG